MSVRFARRRTALRAALTAAAVTGAVLVPAAGAFADSAQPTAKPTATKPVPSQAPDAVKGCTVTKTIKSVFAGWTVELSNGPAGPKAVLRDEKGKTVSVVDTKVETDEKYGLKIVDSEGLSPVFEDRNQGGAMPWRKTAFPKPPKGCVGQPGVPGTVTQHGCTVTKTIQAVFGGWTVDLSNGPSGPKAVMKDQKGKSVETVDRNHVTSNSMRIIGAGGTSPRFEQNNQGGGHPWTKAAFPALPKSCVKTTTTGTTTTGTTTNTTSGGQTKTLPKGSVAAGAENVTAKDNSALIVAGGVAGAAGVAGLGVLVLRRRRSAVAGV
ncbi:hypothetical protein [Streptomyces sp. SPB162]|uniref:hypothetical protein n=1 Tax=Streptomyces sp. SPB162 TaxID=2940560 RepID=UPI002405B635|nr:hypothetical protein [Streptomyces sp. SPB162]MDF9814489.1 hypothetical protein [Streptomyces sp. SPB162]